MYKYPYRAMDSMDSMDSYFQIAIEKNIFLYFFFMSNQNQLSSIHLSITLRCLRPPPPPTFNLFFNFTLNFTLIFLLYFISFPAIPSCTTLSFQTLNIISSLIHLLLVHNFHHFFDFFFLTFLFFHSFTFFYFSLHFWFDFFFFLFF